MEERFVASFLVDGEQRAPSTHLTWGECERGLLALIRERSKHLISEAERKSLNAVSEDLVRLETGEEYSHDTLNVRVSIKRV